MKVEIDLEQLTAIVKALQFYADPDTYWACMFMFDRPTGGFDEDFSDFKEYGEFLDGETPDVYYEDRERPGLAARNALRVFIKENPELVVKLWGDENV